MAIINIELTQTEIEMLLICIDSAIDIVEFTKEEMKRAKKLRKELIKHL
jgi:hypothetical protein